MIIKVPILPVRFFLVTLAAISVAASACTDHGRDPNDVIETVRLRVMTFNIEWGGANISFNNVVEAIRRAEADIVGIQEAEGNLRRLANALGWFYDERNYAISRFPLLDPPGADGRYVFVEVTPGKVVALANVHLPSDPYGVDLVRDGAVPEAVLELERLTRLPKIVPYLDSLQPLIEQSMPVFLTGDFNAPAHTDWTREMVGARPFLSYPLEWPVSRAVEAAGLLDSWRVAHPDPGMHPGLTWWARRPPLQSYTPGAFDAEDRIDFVCYGGPADVISSQIVGEVNFPGVSISVEPWPSDHRGVVSEFAVIPAEVPALLATRHRVYRAGDEIEVLIRRAIDSDIRLTQIRQDNEPIMISIYKVPADDRMVIAADRLPSGHYNLSMNISNSESINYDFWILERDAAPEVEVIGVTFANGEAIEIHWRNAPGYRNDYLTIAEEGAIAGNEGGLSWLYINAEPEGRVNFGAKTAESGWPIPPGTYVARLMKDDGFEILAQSATFTIR